jgi:hypothetical protein
MTRPDRVSEDLQQLARFIVDHAQCPCTDYVVKKKRVGEDRVRVQAFCSGCAAVIVVEISDDENDVISALPGAMRVSIQ